MNGSIKARINTFGRVGKIISNIIIVFMLVIEGFILLAGIIMLAMPEDTASIDLVGNAEIRVDAGRFGLDDGNFSVKIGDSRIAVASYGDKAAEMKVDEEGIATVNTGDMKLHYTLRDGGIVVLISGVRLACYIVALFFFKGLMKCFMGCDTPFCDEVVNRLRNFAIVLIPTFVVASTAGSLMGRVISKDIFNIGSFNFMSVALVVVIFMLSAIFRYGTELQKEHDETV